MFSAAVAGGAVSLVVIGVLTSAIAGSFYVRVIVVMFFRDAGEVDSGGAGSGRFGSAGSGSAGSGSAGSGSAGSGEVAFARRPVTYAVVGVAVVVTILLGIMPQPLLDLASTAAAFAG